MSAPIVRLFGLIVVLFALLIGWTSRWTVFEANSLDNNSLNKLTLFNDVKIKRGQIIADDGTNPPYMNGRILRLGSQVNVTNVTGDTPPSAYTGNTFQLQPGFDLISNNPGVSDDLTGNHASSRSAR